MKKIFMFLFLMLFLSSMINFVVAQEIIYPEQYLSDVQIPEPDDGPTDEEIQQINQRKIKENIFNTTVIILLVATLVMGAFLTSFLVRKNSKVLNIIIHGIILLGSLILSITNGVDTIRCLFDRFCGTSVLGFLFFVTVPVFLLSLFIMIKLVFRKDYSKKYLFNFSSGVVLTSVLFLIFSILAELIIRPEYYLPATLGIAILTFIIGLAFYFILGIIGLFMDVSKK